MKRSTQWDISAIFALFVGFSMLMAFIYGGLSSSAGRKVSLFINLYGNPLVGVFAIAFSFMCFIFGFLEGRKEEH